MRGIVPETVTALNAVVPLIAWVLPGSPAKVTVPVPAVKVPLFDQFPVSVRFLLPLLSAVPEAIATLPVIDKLLVASVVPPVPVCARLGIVTPASDGGVRICGLGLAITRRPVLAVKLPLVSRLAFPLATVRSLAPKAIVPV